MSDLSSAASHLKWLNDLQSRLSSVGVAVLEHKYLLLIMGSFSLVVGNAHRRIKYEWDGREFFLNIQECTCQSQSSPQVWHQIKNVRVAPPEKVETLIETHCVEGFNA